MSKYVEIIHWKQNQEEMIKWCPWASQASHLLESKTRTSFNQVQDMRGCHRRMSRQWEKSIYSGKSNSSPQRSAWSLRSQLTQNRYSVQYPPTQELEKELRSQFSSKRLVRTSKGAPTPSQNVWKAVPVNVPEPRLPEDQGRASISINP